MTDGICAAVSEDIALGLSLAGVNDLFIYHPGVDDSEVKEWYHGKLKEGVSIMVLSGECGDILTRELFERRVIGDLLPITVLIPGEEEDSRAADLIKRAIGMVPSQEDNTENQEIQGGI